MAELYNISSSPHDRKPVKTANLMRDVVIALIPTSLFGIWQFGLKALLLLVVTVAAAVLSEYAWEKLMHKKVTIDDWSAVVTGMILALNMPVTVPIWLPVLGAVFAIIVVKQLYGGLGRNFMNPALAARCFLLISFAGLMNDFSVANHIGYDAVSGATPLAIMSAGGTVNFGSLFLGTMPGTIGEVSKIALLIGAAWMLYRNVVTPRIPVGYIGAFAIIALIHGHFDFSYMLCQVFAGGLIFGAFFMADDYVTSPITPSGQWLYGIFLGLITALFRYGAGAPEGVSYSILLGNLIAPTIDHYTLPVAFGRRVQKKTTVKADTTRLFAITVIAGLALGSVYLLTLNPIQKARDEKAKVTYQASYPAADHLEYLADEAAAIEKANAEIASSGIEKVSIDHVLEAYDASGNVIGYVINSTSGSGYGGDVTVATGISKDGKLTGIGFTSISETPGLGMNATKPEFMDQFAGKDAVKLEYVKNGAAGSAEFNAISGASRTSGAVRDAVNAAVWFTDTYLK